MIDHSSPSPESLARRILEMEDIARELARATEEADRSLVKLQSLYDVSRELSATLNVSQIMQKTVHHLTTMTVASSGAIWLSEGGTLYVETAAGVPPDAYQNLFIPATGNGNSLTTLFHTPKGSFITRNSSYAQDHALLDALNTSVILALPLTVQDATLGIVTLHSRDRSLEQEIDLVQTVVQQAATAIQNGRLYEEVQQLNQTLEQRIATRTRELVGEKERLEIMYQITTSLANTLEQEEMMQQTLEHLARAIAANQGMVLHYDAERNQLSCQAILPEQPLPDPLPAYVQTLAQRVMVQRHGVVVGDLHETPRWQNETAVPHAVVAVPLLAERHLQGVLLLTDDMPYKFAASHLRLVETGAAQLATAIDNAKLHAYVQQQVFRLEEMLHVQEVETSQKQAFLSSIADGVIACDMNGRILLVNPTATRILDQPEVNLLQSTIQDAFQVLDVGCPKILRAFQELKAATDSPYQMRDLTLELKHRVLNARLSQVSTVNQGTIGAIIVLRDITKEVEAARAKSEFITTVSHELRTPMTSIKGYTDLLQRGMVGTLNEQQAKFVDVVYRNAERLSLLINDLLDVSRIEAGKIKLDLQDVDLADLAQEVFETMLVPAQSKGLSLLLDLCPDLPSVNADRDRITQVLTNLVGNAVAYTEAGSVTIRACRVADAVHVSVEDTGIGIPNDEMPHIFERFYRSDHKVVQKNSGTGLGLSIVKDFVEMHGGRIWVKSEPGAGTTFTFILPL